MRDASEPPHPIEQLHKTARKRWIIGFKFKGNWVVNTTPSKETL